MSLRDAAQKALDAFDGLLTFNTTSKEYAQGRDAKDALREALAKPPAQARQPLTFAQVCDLMPPDFGWNDPCTPGLVRHIIEAAHGINATPADKEQP